MAFFLIQFQDNCPAGCPCDEYPCAETTTTPDVTTSTTSITSSTTSTTSPATTTSPTSNAVLVLSQGKSIVIDWDGKFVLENNEMSSNFHLLR